MTIALVLAQGACKHEKKWDKLGACERIHQGAHSAVAKAKWMEACSAAEDQLVRCMGLGEDTPDGKDCAAYGLGGAGYEKHEALVTLLGGIEKKPDKPVESKAVTGVDAGTVGSDEDHELWQAAVTSGDPEIMKRVNVRLGLADENGVPSEKMKGFSATHAGWSTKHAEFVNGMVDAAKARAFVEDHTK
jgi:hypothetical protein